MQLSEFSPESTLSFDGLTNVSHEVAAAVELDRYGFEGLQPLMLGYCEVQHQNRTGCMCAYTAAN